MIFISCEEKFTSPELEKSFSSSQISDFKTIVKFFTQQICQNNEKLEFKNCYEKILPELVEYGWNPILENVDFEKQKEMYKSISKSTFDEIWRYSKTYGAANSISAHKYIGITMRGEYIKYLKEIGLKNKFLSEYTQGIRESGGIESYGHLEAHIFNNPQDLDLNDPNVQILISIHYLGFPQKVKIENYSVLQI